MAAYVRVYFKLKYTAYSFDGIFCSVYFVWYILSSIFCPVYIIRYVLSRYLLSRIFCPVCFVRICFVRYTLSGFPLCGYVLSGYVLSGYVLSGYIVQIYFIKISFILAPHTANHDASYSEPWRLIQRTMTPMTYKRPPCRRGVHEGLNSVKRTLFRTKRPKYSATHRSNCQVNL